MVEQIHDQHSNAIHPEAVGLFNARRVCAMIPLFFSALLLTMASVSIPGKPLIGVLGTLVGMFIGVTMIAVGTHPPSYPVRAIMSLLVVGTTLLVCVLLHFHAVGSAHRANRLWWQLAMCLTAPFAALSAVKTHQPSSYIRSSIMCVSGTWVQTALLALAGLEPLSIHRGWGGSVQARVSHVAFHMSTGVKTIVLCWAFGLLMRRASTVGAPLGQCHKFLQRWIATMMFFPTVGIWVGIVLQCHPMAAACNFMVCILSLVCATLAVREYLIPLRLLWKDAERLRGVPRDEATWAARVLLMEVLAAAVNATSAAIMTAAFGLFWSGVISESVPITCNCVDPVINASSITVLSGILHRDTLKLRKLHKRKVGKDAVDPTRRRLLSVVELVRVSTDTSEQAWQGKVQELACRGFALKPLIDFYASLGYTTMPKFNPLKHTTNDVVWQAIIPLSRNEDEGGVAMATVWNKGQPVLPTRMVTHSWSNLFQHLVAAIVADALNVKHYDEVIALLDPARMPELDERLRQKGTLFTTYWVCAFSINQHAGICGGFALEPVKGTKEWKSWNEKRCDTVSGELLPICPCAHPKYFNDTPTACEMNKFSCMMAYLNAFVPTFSQVMAVDMDFKVFFRAWCVAELVEARDCSIPQSIKIHSEKVLDSNYDKLGALCIQDCEASRPEDKDYILAQAGDLDDFNEHLQGIIFGADGLLHKWMDAESRVAGATRVAMRALQRESLTEERLISWRTIAEQTRETTP